MTMLPGVAASPIELPEEVPMFALPDVSVIPVNEYDPVFVREIFFTTFP